MAPVERNMLRSRKRAMTLIELVLASAITALTAAAGATMVHAIANAASDTRDYRTDRAEGNSALYRMASLIRSAKALGEVTSTSVTIWEHDANKNDTVDLYETSIIRYDATYQMILYEHFVPANGIFPSSPVAKSTLTNTALLGAAIQGSEKQTMILAEGVSTFSFVGYPSNTDTRVVQTSFTIPRGDQTVAFNSAASPRPAADYLLVADTLLPDTVIPANTTSGQKRRKIVSPWSGLTPQLMGVTPTDLSGI